MGFFMMMKYGFLFLTTFFMSLSAKALCLKINVEKGFFQDKFSTNSILLQSEIIGGKTVERYFLNTQNKRDIRVRFIPLETLKTYIVPETQDLKLIPESVLEEYSPYEILIEYKTSTAPKDGVLTKKKLKKENIIEVCHLVDRGIHEDAGWKEALRQSIKGNKVFNTLQVSLKYNSSKATLLTPGSDIVTVCGSFNNIEPSKLKINLKRNGDSNVDCSAIPVVGS